jgi:hypothetical protein
VAGQEKPMAKRFCAMVCKACLGGARCRSIGGQAMTPHWSYADYGAAAVARRLLHMNLQ